jgi:hypothetical protein
MLSGFARAAGPTRPGSAPINVERPPTPRESRRLRARPTADRTGPSHFHDVDNREDVDDLRQRGRFDSRGAAVAKLNELKSLLGQGLISQAQYDADSRKLLDQIIQ